MQKEENNSFSRKVRMLRLDFGLTQPDLAKLMDVSVRTVASWESGDKKRKHEEMLWDQVRKTVESKKRKSETEEPIANTNTELEEDQDMIYQKKYERLLEKHIATMEEVALLRAQLLGKPQPLGKKKRS